MNAASPPVALVLGANGRFGCAAAQAFAVAGWTVLAQVRGQPSPLLPAAAVVLRAALDDTAAVVAAADIHRIHVIVHAINPRYTRWEDEALPALEAGLALARRSGALFMLPGNVYNFGETMPAFLDEAVPQRPTTRKGEIRRRMEARIAERAKSEGFPACVIRAGDFFGAGRGNWFDAAIVKSLRAGKLVYPGPLDRPHAWAYLPDLARAFVKVAGQARHPSFATWHFEGHTLTGAALLDAVEAVAAQMGLAPHSGFRRGGMPWTLIGAVGLVVPLWRELARMSYLWRVPHALDGRPLEALSGPALVATPLSIALRRSLGALGYVARPAAGACHPTRLAGE